MSMWFDKMWFDNMWFDDNKLPILTDESGKVENIDKVKNNVKIWAYRRRLNPRAKKLLVNGVMAIVDHGMICTVNGASDGDWVFESSPEVCTDGIDMDSIDSLISEKDMLTAVSLIIAIKADFWSTKPYISRSAFVVGLPNNSAITGHLKQMVKFHYPEGIDEDMKKTINILGDFCSTLNILSLAGIENIREATPCIKKDGVSTILSDQQKQWFKSLPAGTKLLQFCYRAACEFLSHEYAKECYCVEELKAIPGIREKILENRASYHPEASYLTGKPRADYDDKNCENWMGRLGIFFREVKPESSIARSWHFKREEKLQSYLDYDPSWRFTLQCLLLDSRKMEQSKEGNTVLTNMEKKMECFEENNSAEVQLPGFKRPKYHF